MLLIMSFLYPSAPGMPVIEAVK